MRVADTIRLGVVMDPIGAINPAKDSSLAMLLEAQARGMDLHYFEQNDLRRRNGEALGSSRRVRVTDSRERWFELGARADLRLASLDVILMRKDPPFDTEYVYTTYILERAAQEGSLVLNRPASLRDINEKAFTAWFPQCCPDTLITRSMADMRAFLAEHGHIVVKPLHGMGGRSIFVVRQGDRNANVIFETLTEYDTRHAVAQRYIPEIRQVDKLILLVDGEPPDHVLARVPAEDDNRGNLVMGAAPEVRPLSARDRWIAGQVGPVLRERGVLFAGIDVIGDYLTEINVTSPTGIRELKKYGGTDLAARFLDVIEARLRARQR
ncbi:MAG: glutathione synthase [Gammaproteobacteria bacterium]|nr:glutathione synthase [Gammaproteobacteria bacterium]